MNNTQPNSSSHKKSCFNSFSTLRNFQARQQGFLLGLLNLHYDIYVEAPKKKSVVTQPFLNIVKLVNGTETILVRDIVTSLVNQMYKIDIEQGVTQKTATRRYDVNRITEQLIFLANILKKMDVEIQTKVIGIKKSKDKIASISYEDLYFNSKDIQRKGCQINHTFINCFNQKMSPMICLNKNDVEIMSIIIDY
ncbi:BAG domain-containing protein [Entamoeba marina]